MQTKLTVLAGAAALALMAGSASATIDLTDTGDSEVVFSIWDPIANAGYTRDLGFNQSTLTTAGTASQSGVISNTGSLSMQFAADDLLTQFLTTYAADASSLLWNVAGGDSTGITAGSKRTITTAQTSVTKATIQLLQGTQMFNMLGNENNYFSQVNSGTTGTQQTQANGSNIEVTGDGLGNDMAYAGGPYWGTGFGNTANFSNAAGLGQSLNFWSLANGATASAKITATQFLGAGGNLAQWTLANDGTLTFAAVPEADTWALLGLGLIGVGALARRRGRDLQAA
jgi:hypothetical protein